MKTYIVVRDYTGREIAREYGDFQDAIRRLNERITWQDGDHLFIVNETVPNWLEEDERFDYNIETAFAA